MTFLILVIALGLDHFWPRPLVNRYQQWLYYCANRIERYINAGCYYHGVLAWLLYCGLFSSVTLLLYLGCQKLHPLLGGALATATVYLSIDFRRVSTRLTTDLYTLQQADIAIERNGEIQQQLPKAASNISGMIRLSIRQALLMAYQGVFAVMFWFVALGPVGVVCYCITVYLSHKWPLRSYGRFAAFSHHCLYYLDWLPMRLTAFSFAVMGNFTDTLYCWQIFKGDKYHEHRLLACGSGALGVRLVSTSAPSADSSFTLSESLDQCDLRQALGLLWRCLLLWLALILLFTFAGWII